MNHVKSIIFILYCLCVITASAQPVAEVRTYGGAFFDEGRQVIETESGYLLVGTSSSIDNGNSDIYVLKVNDDLSVAWTRLLGGQASEQGRSACMTNNGDYLVLGQTANGPNGAYDLVVYRLSPEGEVIWEKYYGTDDWDLATRIVKGDNNYYIASTTYGFSPGGSRQWLFRIDEQGTVINGNTFDVLPDAEANDLKWYDGHLYLMGTRTYPGGSPQGILRKLQPSGAMVWEEVRDSASFQGLSVDVSEFGVAAGFAYQDPNFEDSWDMYLVGLNADGGEIFNEWSFTATVGNQFLRGVTWIEDFVIECAATNVFGAGGNGCFINWVNIDGVFIASTVFGGEQDEEPFCIIDDSAGRLLFIGHSESYGNGNKDLYLVRLPDFNISNNYELDQVHYASDDAFTNVEERPVFRPQPWPNPASEVLHLPPGAREWELYGISGAISHTGRGSQISLDRCSKGVYILRWNHEGVWYRDRIIIE